MPVIVSVEPVTFVTGVDHWMFDQVFPLMGSIRRYCPTAAFWVCDFGLTDQQSSLLRRLGVLLEIPVGLGPYRHVWYYKSALGRYIAGLRARAVVWIDVDMMVLSDITSLIDGLFGSMELTGHVLAAAGIETIGEQVSVDAAPHFVRLAEALHPGTRYLNSGFFLCRSAAFLESWFQLCLTMPVEKLFEQNAFNLIAQAQPDTVRVLDMMAWNMCGPQLRGAVIEASGMDVVVSGPHGRTFMLHATSNTRGDIVVQGLRLRINTTVFQVAMKTFSGSEVLRTFQRELFMDSLAENFEALTECGFGTEG